MHVDLQELPSRWARYQHDLLCSCKTYVTALLQVVGLGGSVRENSRGY